MTLLRRCAPLALVLLPGWIGDAVGREGGACTLTARAALRACENEVRDDAWIAVGICQNLADRSARKACKVAAKQARRDDADCADQFDAREALCDVLGQDPYDPVVDPARYLSPAAIAANPNPYFPLRPGTSWTYEGGGETDVVTVTADTRVILGVTCIVVRDVVSVQGVPIEDTEDYFAQDDAGNVWYFGELAKNFEDGRLVDVDGSWIAGREGAKPGIIMPAAPQAGTTHRQEFALGDAEDAGRVESVTASATVPGASCNGDCVQTLDFTPLEPDAREHKFYARGIGLMLEVDLETGDRLELVRFVAGG